MLDKQNDGQKFTFNVYAFMFGLFWFLYRKMYLGALGLFAFLIVVGVIEVYIQDLVSNGLTSNLISWLLSIVSWTATGFFANYLYLKKTQQVINKVTLSATNSERAIKIIKKKGGTSYLFLVIILLIGVAFFIYNNQQ